MSISVFDLWLRVAVVKASGHQRLLWNSLTSEWLQEVAGQVKSIHNPHWSTRWPVCKRSPFTLRAPEIGVAFCYNQHNSKGTSHLSQFHYCLTSRVFVFQTVGNQVKLLVAKTTAKRFSLLCYKPFCNQFHLATNSKVQRQNPVGEYTFIPHDWWLSRRHWLVSRLLWLGPNIYALHTKDYQFETRRRHKPSLTSQSSSIAGPKFR